MYHKVYTDKEHTLSAKISDNRLEIRRYRNDEVITSIPIAMIPILLEILQEVQHDRETEELRAHELVMLAKWNGQ